VRWRGIALSVGSLALAALVWRFSPRLLALVGLGDLGVVGQVGATVLALSALEVLLRRWQAPKPDG
jgi:hypothetical protein